MHKFIRIFAPIQFLMGMVMNVYAEGVNGEATVSTTEVFGFIVLVLAAIFLFSRFKLRYLQMKPVRIRLRKRRR